MAVAKFSFRTVVHGFFMACAFVILIDFALLGSQFNEQIISIAEDYQQYYNAAKNGHFSYRLTTTKHSFPVSESFATSVKTGDAVLAFESPIFKEVNRYTKLGETSFHIYSLRYATGLLIPLLAMLVIALGFFKNKYDILVFVFQVVLLGDFIFLIFW